MSAHAKKALVVDDEPVLRELFADVLTTRGLEVIQAQDGQQAADCLTGTRVDLLVCDLRMPRLDGLQLLAWCRARQHHMPVILISSDADLVDPESIVLSDCCATLLRKPCSVVRLNEAIDAAMRRRHHTHCVHRQRNSSVGKVPVERRNR